MVLKLTFTYGNTAKDIQINNAAVKYLNDTAFSKTISSSVPIVVRYDGSKYIYDEIELATITNAGTVKLGASKVAGLITTPSAQTVTGRYYPVQTDNNNRLVVNVPWENDTNTHYKAEVVTGNSTATASNANNLSNPYIRILDKEGSEVKNSSGVQLKGDGLVSISATGSEITVSASHPTGDEYNHVPAVTSSDNGKILQASYNSNGAKSIGWVDKPSYDKLSATNKNSMYGYLVKGASGLADDTHFLTGAGNWREVIATVSKLQDVADSHDITTSSSSTSFSAGGTLKVSSPEQIKMIKVSAFRSTSPNTPGTVAFFGGTTPNNQFTIDLSKLTITRYNQGGNSNWIVQVEAIGGSTYVAPLYYQFSLQGTSWNVFAL